MKLEILQENLNHALSQVSRIISNKSQLPILGHLLLSAKDSNFEITGSNLETTIVVPIGAKIIAGGEFTIPAKTFQEVISSLPAGKIQLELVGSQLEISSANLRSKINGTPATEYPKVIPKESDNKYWQIKTSDFWEALTETVFSAATDESRAVLNGVLIKPTGQSLVFAATDGFRLSVVTLDGLSDKEAKIASIIIPAATLSELVRILDEEIGDKKDQELKLVFLENNQVLFTINSIQIYSRLISGNFPDFEKIIPSTSSIKIELSAEELSQAIRIASIFARESANIIKLHLAGGKLLVSANAAQVGDNETTLDAKIEKGQSEDFSIAFNYRYILDFLNSLKKETEVSLEFTTSLAPGIFKAKEKKAFLHLIMPVRVQS